MLITTRFVRSLMPALGAVVLLGAAVASHAQTAVDINTADAQTLARGLKGIGPATAARIVAYREVNGPFLAIEDLVLVNGIGEKLFERNRAVLTASAALTADKGDDDEDQP